MALLEIENLEKRYGGIVAVDRMSLKADGSSVVGLIGPNGAGKTTVFNIITGLVHADYGEIRLVGHDIVRSTPYQIAQVGIQRTFQNIRLFGQLSILDNVAMGCLPFRERNLFRARSLAREMLEVVNYRGPLEFRPGQLPYASQRRVEIARSLAAMPKVLLLDEPAAGMHFDEREELATLILSLAKRGLAIILIEHDMALVSRVCEQVLVMDFGRLIAAGTPDEVKADPQVVEAYLGGFH